MLDSHGNFENFELAAGKPGEYRNTQYEDLPFLDSDVYKWLEAIGWELAQEEDASLRAMAEPVIDLIAKAQREDGYLDTYFQVSKPGREFQNMQWGHELYVGGHLAQAAIAWHRGLGDDRLLRIAERFIARLAAELGPGKRELICGHPELEMALIELYRMNGNRDYVEFARTLIDRRGRGLLGRCQFGPMYWQDHEPVRTARRPAGHAVRQLYLECGAVDVAVETGDKELLEAVIHRWEAMEAEATYITGAVGAHHRDEAFGAPYELPSDRAYAETCAAIASSMLSWRLLLATGEERYADTIERAAYNSILPALAPDGSHFFYSNPLKRHSKAATLLDVNQASTYRIPWPGCACCPPNLMRYLASLPDMAVTADADGLQIHQYFPGRFSAAVGGNPVEIQMATQYPWAGSVEVRILESTDIPWTLSMRVPAWSAIATATVVGDSTEHRATTRADRIEITRKWRPGDIARLELDMEPRMMAPDPRIDAIRGCVALVRGPIVYAVEDADLPADASVESLEITADPEIKAETRSDEALGELVWLTFDGLIRSDPDEGWPYSVSGRSTDRPGVAQRVRALPYFAWSNRDRLGMRIWIPRHS
jgi:DUF1680 family protein